jgi:hypothetical protein
MFASGGVSYSMLLSGYYRLMWNYQGCVWRIFFGPMYSKLFYIPFGGLYSHKSTDCREDSKMNREVAGKLYP